MSKINVNNALSKVYASGSSAKCVATKISKALGEKYEVCGSVELGFKVMAPIKQVSASKPAKPLIWAVNSANSLKAKGATRENLSTVEKNGRTRLLIAGKTGTWFFKREYADQVLALI